MNLQSHKASCFGHDPFFADLIGKAGVAHTMHIRMQAGALDIAVPVERTWMELLPG